MRRWEAWWNHAALAAVSLTGLLYGIFKYWVPGPDPDSRAGHPLQPLWLKAHVLLAPLAVFGVGLLLRRHALARIKSGEKNGRSTGVAMLWLFAPLALTGYLIQVFVERGRDARRRLHARGPGRPVRPGLRPASQAAHDGGHGNG